MSEINELPNGSVELDGTFDEVFQGARVAATIYVAGRQYNVGQIISPEGLAASSPVDPIQRQLLRVVDQVLADYRAGELSPPGSFPMVSNGEPLDLEAIKARAEAATLGPWQVTDPNESSGHLPFWVVCNDAFLNPPADDNEPWIAIEFHTGVKEDAAFIAAARSDVPALLAEVEQLRAEVSGKPTMYERVYWAAAEALDEILGPDEEDGTGEGLVQEIWLVAQQRDEARAEVESLRDQVMSAAEAHAETVAEVNAVRVAHKAVREREDKATQEIFQLQAEVESLRRQVAQVRRRIGDGVLDIADWEWELLERQSRQAAVAERDVIEAAKPVAEAIRLNIDAIFGTARGVGERFVAAVDALSQPVAEEGDMTEKGPETALRDTQGDAERCDNTAGLIAELFESFKHQEGWQHRGYDFGLSLAAALRDAGWVDPERAEELRSDLSEDWHSAQRCGVDGPRCPGCVVDELAAERDALLPVVEAARALVRRTDEPKLPPEELSRLLLTLTAAVDLWESRKETP